jgi:hypothetical protein
LDQSEVKNLEEQWKFLKQDFIAGRNIPVHDRVAIEQWAKANLDAKGAKAVIAALEISRSETTRSTKRLQKLDSCDRETLLEPLLNLVLADFSVFEILVGAMERKQGDAAKAIRRLADELDMCSKTLGKMSTNTTITFPFPISL